MRGAQARRPARPSMKFIADGGGIEPEASGFHQQLRSGLDDHGSLRVYAERPRGLLRSVTEQHGIVTDCKWPVYGRGSNPPIAPDPPRVRRAQPNGRASIRPGTVLHVAISTLNLDSRRGS